MREANRDLLKKAGKVVYLRTGAETVYDRIKGDTTRPLLQCQDPLARIKELLAEREETYAEVADLVVDTDGKDVARIVDEIIDGLMI